ncbi:WcaI family glycosyltransferase [Altererythrobacter aquiaggeris]|uniref:WcaI family glycosyltransferase n=1 Tax=Aestuarierythrobacter aquiaggeris TaxID=1898396 RepID=UPI003015A7D4
MNILVLSLNYSPEPLGIGPYSAGTAEALAAAGHRVTVICGKPFYPDWQSVENYRGGLWRTSRENGVTVIRCAHYIPDQPTGFRRIIHQLSFALSAIWPALKVVWGKQRPRLVFAPVPSIMSAPVGYLCAKIASAHFWIHIQDFEVDAAIATGLVKPASMAAKIAMWLEQKMLECADTVSTISGTMMEKAANKGADPARIVEFRNWAEIDTIVPRSRDTIYRQAWNLGDRKVALYSGNIAHKQGIEIIVEAARLLRGRADIVFVICGDGPNRKNLDRLAEGLPNIQLHPLQPREQIGELLATADICLLPQIAGAADLVLPSKLANILAAGRPVIATAKAGTGLAKEVGGAGAITPPGDVGAFARKVEDLLDDPDGLATMAAIARQRAEERWSRGELLGNFVKQVERAA